MRVLYFDCFSGASGDMILGALLDAGASRAAVMDALTGLDVPDWDMDVSETSRSGLRAVKVEVTVGDDPHPRSYAEIRTLLERSPLPGEVRERAQTIFQRLARAEGAVHGVEVEQVHFHEVGSVDAIVDIVGSAAALADLAPEKVLVSEITTGRGLVTGAHGPIPVPAPAVIELLRGAPLAERGEDELITPTGAAILAASADSFGPLPLMTLSSVGYGAGTRETNVPNVLRVLVGDVQTTGSGSRDRLLIETNIDDMSPELIPHVIERLLSTGAEDAWTTPIVMKKGRPAITLSALAPHDAVDELLDVIYAETTTLGVRLRDVGKNELEREWAQTEVEGYPVRVKIARRAGSITNIAPEYEDAVKVANVTGLPLKEVYARAVKGFEV